MSNLPSAYCPLCNTELEASSIVAHSRNIVWRCPNNRCGLRNIELVSDGEGWVMDPDKHRGRYLFSSKK